MSSGQGTPARGGKRTEAPDHTPSNGKDPKKSRRNCHGNTDTRTSARQLVQLSSPNAHPSANRNGLANANANAAANQTAGNQDPPALSPIEQAKRNVTPGMQSWFFEIQSGGNDTQCLKRLSALSSAVYAGFNSLWQQLYARLAGIAHIDFASASNFDEQRNGGIDFIHDFATAVLDQVKAFNHNPRETVLPALYEMADDSDFHGLVGQQLFQYRRLVVETMDCLSRKKKPDKPDITSYEMRRRLSHLLQQPDNAKQRKSSPGSLITLVHHKREITLGRGLQTNRLAPQNITIVQRHLVPIMFTMINALEVHFNAPRAIITKLSAALASSNDAANTTMNWDQLHDTQKRCYGLYTHPTVVRKEPGAQDSDRYAKFFLPPESSFSRPPPRPFSNLFAMSEFAGLGKSELMRVAVLAGLLMGKTVVVCRTTAPRAGFIQTAVISPDPSVPTEYASEQLGGIPYHELVGKVRAHIEAAIHRFSSKELVVVIDPPGCEKHNEGPLEHWSLVHGQLAEAHEDVMFFAAHNTVRIEPTKETNIYYHPLASDQPFRNLTFLGVAPDYPPILEAVEKLLEASPHVDKRYEEIAAPDNIINNCNPDLRSVFRMIDDLVECEQPAVALRQIRHHLKFNLTPAFISLHDLQSLSPQQSAEERNLAPMKTEKKRKHQTGSTAASKSDFVGKSQAVSPLNENDFHGHIVYQYDPTQALSFQITSPLLAALGYVSKTPPVSAAMRKKKKAVYRK